jgi:phosphoribosyl 1,2-cyclic phosphodiesterase
MKVKFWGVRGSIPCPGPQTVKYGGNTVCLELRFPDSDRRIIIDAGSGLRGLGDHMVANGNGNRPIRADLLLTHTHLDHILGIPFFTPIYIPGTQMRIYGPVTCEEESLETVLGGQLSYRYFPVRQAELAAQIEYFDLKEGSFYLGEGIRVTAKYLNHPLLCFGYRIECNGQVFCTAYDTEPFYNIFSTDPEDPNYDEALAQEGDQAARLGNRGMEEFVAGADLLVYDGQYTRQEYEKDKIGWGHTPMEFAIELARRSGTQKLALIHHDPMRTDAQLDLLADQFCSPLNNADTQVFFAREGVVIDI